MVGQPGLLQPAQRDGRGGVASEDGQIAALVEQLLAAGASQFDNLFARATAVGRVGLVGEIDEIGGGQAADEGVMDAQTPDPRIKDAYSHAFL